MENTTERREFLKKVAYTAPVIIALGTLTNLSAAGSSSFTLKTCPTDYKGFDKKTKKERKYLRKLFKKFNRKDK